MPAPIDAALDNLTRIVLVVKKDRKLRLWFDGLSKKAAPDRRHEIIVMCAKMRAEGEDAGLIAVFQLLADERVFEAARVALAE